ncbi:MAG: hypothetical protein HC924_07460 [Synechococcaceae cyanobacterium SM2_3_2]|nr:hypothetical protein [Synechococcaceae cyanobacterium SM2_3_2]
MELILTPQAATWILGRPVETVVEWATAIWCKPTHGRATLIPKRKFTLGSLIQTQSEHGFITTRYSPRVLVIWDPTSRNGWSHMTYIGYDSRNTAERALIWMDQRGHRGSLRPAKRLRDSCTQELKLPNLPWSMVENLVSKDLGQSITLQPLEMENIA